MEDTLAAVEGLKGLDRGRAKAGGLPVLERGPGLAKDAGGAGRGEESRIRSQKCARPTGEAMVAPQGVPRNAPA